MIGWESGRLLIRLAGAIFQDKVSYLKLNWRIVIGVC